MRKSHTYLLAIICIALLGMFLLWRPGHLREQHLQLVPNSKNVPINFYGRVVDQDKRPLPGVRVAGFVRQWYYVPAVGISAKYPKIEAVTDDDGRFQFSDASGDDLKIESLEKADYEAEPQELRDFGYNISENHVPDPSNPVVLTMWKIGMKQSLVVGDKLFPIIPDGRVYTMDLLNCTLTEGEGEGDFQISLRRAQNAAWGKKYDWSFSMSVSSGGVVEESNPNSSMSIAPKTNYTNALSKVVSESDEGWGYTFKKRLYCKTRATQIFGRMDIQIDAFYLKDKQGRLSITYAVNPSGSPVLR